MDSEDRIRRVLDILAECDDLDDAAIDARLASESAEVVADVRRILARQPPEGFLAPPDSVPPELVDYEILEQLGIGGMGVVLGARHRASGDLCAIKLLRGLDAMDPVRAAAFRREASRAFTLRHPNIVAIRGVGEHGGIPYIVMDQVRGPTLGELLRGERERARGVVGDDAGWPEATRRVVESPISIARFLAQVADALHYSHELGILHLDVKPSNILIDHGEPRLVDFGIAQDLITERGAANRAGTPHYMSPEQARVRTSVDRRTDVYSLGVIAYESLTFRRPFEGETETDVLSAVLRAEAPTVRTYNPDVPPGLDRIVQKAMRSLPGLRYKTAKDFADDLRRFARGETPLARPPTIAQRTAAWCGSRRTFVSVAAVIVSTALFSALVVSHCCAPKISRLIVPRVDAVQVRVDRFPLGGNRSGERVVDWSDAAVELELESEPTYRIQFRDASGSTAEAYVRALEKEDYVVAPGPLRSSDDFASSMVYVAGGAFLYGDQTPVTVDSLFVDRLEVTNGEYLTFMVAEGLEAPSHWPPEAERAGAEFLSKPVSGVDQASAERFASSIGKRLPTAFEWEWIARGPDNRKFVWGDSPEAPAAGAALSPIGKEGARRYLQGAARDAFDRESYRTEARACGTSPDDVSWCGVFDLQGSVCEWTASSRFDAESGVVDHRMRQVKGDSFRALPGGLIFAGEVPSKGAKDFTTGFRCVKTALTQ